ncbi:MAG: enoyl-CoA hydratase-related protein [Candidatus Thermoplasmatota archaeon]
MEYENIIIKKENGIGILKINRPSVLNALNTETILELISAVKDLDSDQEVKVVILTGEGRSFIAGADIKEMGQMTPVRAKSFSELGYELVSSIEHSRLPFIAAVNGYALGGGCELMMACDLAIASKTAVIGQPEINLGIPPGFGGTQRLPRLVGVMKAKEMLFTGEPVTALEALDMGLVCRVVEPEELMEEALRLAGKIRNKSSLQVGIIKSLVNTGVDMDLSSACRFESALFSMSFSTKDQKEGMTAFIEKRKPVFKDE